VFLTALPVFLVISIPHEVSAPLVARDFVGLGLWLLGFSVEVVADRQKACRADKTRFIDTGLWSISRHPNCTFNIRAR
jgi:steroid 5-alpha reductase family enzyme